MSFKISKLIIIIFIFIYSCNQKKVEENKIENIDLAIQMRQAYNEGVKALEYGDGLKAAQKFSEAEIVFPQSIISISSNKFFKLSAFSLVLLLNVIFEAFIFLSE